MPRVLPQPEPLPGICFLLRERRPPPGRSACGGELAAASRGEQSQVFATLLAQPNAHGSRTERRAMSRAQPCCAGCSLGRRGDSCATQYLPRQPNIARGPPAEAQHTHAENRCALVAAMRPPEASGEVAGEGADAATEKLSPRAGSGASDEDELSGTAFAPNAFRRLRDLEDRTVQIAAVMAILAVASIVLAIAEVELAVLRLPVTAALSLVGSCRAGRPSLLVRSGLAHTGLEGVLAYAPRVMPASPQGVLSVGNAADPAAVGGNASTAWALPLLNDQAPFCDPGAGSRLPPASENVTAGRPCSLDGNGMAAALLGIADRFAGKGASSLGPRAWALLLGSRRGCFDGLRSGTVSPGGGFLLPPARDTAAARGSAGTLEALGVGPTGMGVAGWPASSLEASERAVVLLPAPGALALERLAESIAAEFGGSATSLRLSALNDTARRVWAHALAAGGFPSGASLADGVATAASAQPSAALRRRALLAVEAATGVAGGWLSLLGLACDGPAAACPAAGGPSAGESTRLLVSAAREGGGGEAVGWLAASSRDAVAAAAVAAAARASAPWSTAPWLGHGGHGTSPASLVAAEVLPLTEDETLEARAASVAGETVTAVAWGVRAAQSAVTVALLCLAAALHWATGDVRALRRRAAPQASACAPVAALGDVARAARRAALSVSRTVFWWFVRCLPLPCVAETASQRRQRRMQRRAAARSMRDSYLRPTAAESRRNSSAFGKPARSESRRGTLSDPWTRLRATAGQLQQAPGSACLWGPAFAATAEALALAIHVPAGTWPELEAAVGPSAYVVVALAPICLRLPLLLRAAYLLSELSTGSGRLLVALSGQSFSFSFFVKTTLRQHAFACTVGIVVGAIAFTSVALHAAETLVCAASHVPACAPLSLPEAVYMTAISITTVGFGGRLTPRTTVGGGIVVLASFAALLATAVAVAQLVAFMQFDAAQDQVVALIRKASVRNARAALAAGAIQAAWHWSQEHRQSLLWTRGRASGVIYRSVASRASATLRATGAVARWAAFRAIAGRQLLDADMGPRRRVLAAFTLLRVDEARETARQALQLAADAEATVTAGISPQQAARVRSPSPDAVIAGGRLGMGWARSSELPARLRSAASPKARPWSAVPRAVRPPPVVIRAAGTAPSSPGGAAGAQEDEVAAAFRAAAEQARALAARLSGRQHTPA